MAAKQAERPLAGRYRYYKGFHFWQQRHLALLPWTGRVRIPQFLYRKCGASWLGPEPPPKKTITLADPMPPKLMLQCLTSLYVSQTYCSRVALLAMSAKSKRNKTDHQDVCSPVARGGRSFLGSQFLQTWNKSWEFCKHLQTWNIQVNYTIWLCFYV